MRKYFKIWLKNTILSLQTDLVTRGASLLFIIGKFLRFYFFLFSILVILGESGRFGVYTTRQVITFFLVFNLLDMAGQIFFRGIYWFRNEIITGHFDLTLVKPINPLFAAMTDKTDLLDVPLFFIIVYLLIKYSLGYSWMSIMLFLLLAVAAFLIITSIHILVAVLGILTTEIDHVIWIYRDLSVMMRFPVDIYAPALRIFLTFVIPVGVIFTFPAKALMGVLSWQGIIYAFFSALLFLFLSLKLWQWSLRKYSSASS